MTVSSVEVSLITFTTSDTDIFRPADEGDLAGDRVGFLLLPVLVNARRLSLLYIIKRWSIRYLQMCLIRLYT
jgi:hypothetical protein